MHLLEQIIARYESENCPSLAAGIRDAVEREKRTLSWRSIRPRGFQTNAQAIPPGKHPADFWDEILKSDPDAYDRPSVWVGLLGPCHIHSAAFAEPEE
jgi:hypothetical protein